MVSVFWLVVQKLFTLIHLMVFDANNGNQPMDSEANITMFNAFNNAALVDCCLVCFYLNDCHCFV
jgi:hypothetical protein